MKICRKISRISDCNIIIFVILFLGMCSCRNSVEKDQLKKRENVTIQSYIDSCATLYSMAIAEAKQGQSKEEVKFKYAGDITSLHSRFSQSFDSITLAYTNKRLTQTEYDQIMRSIVLDTVAKRSEELAQLGVVIELK